MKRFPTLSLSMISLTWILLSIIPALAVLWLDETGRLVSLHNMAYDALFYLRAKTCSPETRADSPVALIGIDDKTFADDRFRVPVILWNDHFSMVIQGLANGGAKVIGLDYLLPQVQFDEQKVPGYNRPWLKAFVYAKTKGTTVISGVVQRPDRQLRPDKTYIQIIGPENMGLFNLTPDSDDFIRRQQLSFPAKNAESQGLDSLPLLLTRKAFPKLTWPAIPIYINFDHSPTPYPRHSFLDVYVKALAGDVSFFQKHFQGKIVLIGETDSLSGDRHDTPLYYLRTGIDKRLPGVEIHVHTINTLLNQNFFTELPMAARAALYLILSLIAGLVTYKSHRTWALAFRLFLLITAFLGISFVGFLHFVILPLAETVTATVLSAVCCFVYRFVTVDREKRQTREAFSKYVNPQVVDEIMGHPEMLQLGGARRTMTVFFSDLAGFTTLSESLSPEALVHLLNRYLDLMTQAILDRGGTVDKFEGDAIMAFWGAPLPQEDHALLACLAAMDQQAAMDKLRKELISDGLPELNVRMGLNTGPMIVGNMGSKTRFNYTVMGDAVNLASRLEGANKAFASTVMISESTYEAVKDHVEVRELDLIRVKGRNEPIRVYELWSKAGELSSTRIDLRKTYLSGLEAYRNMNFGQALEFFEQALRLNPEDGPTKTYIQRCRTFLESPPPENWDRVFTLTTK
ncbi:MAG: CHASE2 domain-containing protein [Deltaproteobacteria bacterium]|nr:CHASE2 domain-containing protein [Deltaproteobacteria bacterium]